MFLPFIPKAIYDKTNIFRIQGTIIWYWLLFTTFVIRHVPYIGWWRYVRENSLIIKIWSCFLNALLGHSRIVINFVHNWNITICQAKNSKARKNNLDKYTTSLQWLIIMNVFYCFGEFDISSNTDEFSRLYSGLKNFLNPQVSMNYHEISSHSSLVSTK